MGHTVIGIEFVQEAVEQFFQEQNIKYSVKVVDEFKLFTVKIVFKRKLVFFIFKFISNSKSEDGKIRIYNGDFFKFTKYLFLYLI